ncbi:MAG: 50S ribosomal protein L33 [Myxococcales bacterium]|nr:50S ribosomal protein L33 [Myxococcales bacterium]MDD9970112.1 50S ribosomal protein L33 [Myxococcales bacterium]
MANRQRVTLVCDDCGARNYQTTKSPAQASERLTLKKFCSVCNKHTVHKESK